MSEIYDIIFTVDGSIYLKDYAKILSELNDLGLWINQATMSFESDYATLCGQYNTKELSLKTIERFCERTPGLELDWDLMGE